MKAAVCYELGKPLVIEEVDMDPPQRGEVKVRVAATGICHTDIHFIKGQLGGRPPFVPGHESAGYVEEVGEGVSSIKPGDAVVVSLVSSCGKCHFCTIGRPNMCIGKMALATGNRLRNKRGQSLSAMLRVGGFAEYVIVDQSQAVPIPRDISMDGAALLGCGVITGFGAVTNTAKVKPLSSVVVLGIGGVGLNTVQGAVVAGAYPIIAVTRSEGKLAAARAFGATHTVKAGQPDTIDAVKKLTFGRGADYVFVTVGDSAVIEQGFAMTGRCGMTVIVGLSTERISFSPMEFFSNEKILTASFMGTTRLSVDIPRYVALYQAGRLKLDELISKRYSLEQINEAIEDVEKGGALRNVIMF